MSDAPSQNDATCQDGEGGRGLEPVHRSGCVRPDTAAVPEGFRAPSAKVVLEAPNARRIDGSHAAMYVTLVASLWLLVVWGSGNRVGGEESDVGHGCWARVRALRKARHDAA